MPDTEDGQRWLNTGEAAARLGIGTRALYRLIDEAALPAYRFGRVIRLQRHDSTPSSNSNAFNPAPPRSSVPTVSHTEQAGALLPRRAQR